MGLDSNYPPTSSGKISKMVEITRGGVFTAKDPKPKNSVNPFAHGIDLLSIIEVIH
jgi:hypothetical protein